MQEIALALAVDILLFICLMILSYSAALSLYSDLALTLQQRKGTGQSSP